MAERPSIWRILYSGTARGAWNMAVDEAVLETSASGASPTTLRMYAWQPACLSLGIAQSFAEIDWPALEERGWHVVRRPTGGRAILHTDELTYSICGPQSEPRLAGGVLESYRVISAALLETLRILGVDAAVNEIPALGASTAARQPSGEQARDPVCFTEPSNYEITAAGKKVFGSAQARRLNAVLQHGSLPLVGDLRRIVQVLRYSTQEKREIAASRVSERAATLQQLTGKSVSWWAAARAMQQAFESVLGLEFQAGELTADELSRAAELEAQKYADPAWTERI